MRPKYVCSRLIGLIALFVLLSSTRGQDNPELSAEKRAALIAERDVLAKQAISKASQRDFEGAQKLFDRVLDVEKSVFGEAHEELLGTLDYQAQVANAAKDWMGVIDYRQQAYELGKRLYPPNAYQLRDLELALEEAKRDATWTDEQRRLLLQASVGNRQVAAMYQQGKPLAAIDLARRVVGMRKTLLGPESLSYATALNNLASLYQSLGQYRRAEPLFLEARNIVEKVLGKRHPKYAYSLNNLAIVYALRSNFRKAEPLYVEAVRVQRDIFSKEHPDYVRSSSNLATVYREMGKLAEAEQLHREAMGIREATLGKSHPDYASSLNNLGLVLFDRRDHERAESLFAEAMTIQEKTLGKQHPNYAHSLNNLASSYGSRGDYPRAVRMMSEAKSILENALGKEHPKYAICLSTLATLCNSMGDSLRAESLLSEVREIREKVFGKENPAYALSLHSIASYYSGIGDYTRAEAIYLEAKEILENAVGKKHPTYALNLNSLAVQYRMSGDYAKSEPLAIEARDIRREILGEDHPDYARCLLNLALLYQLMGDFPRAEALYVEAKHIFEEALGKQHPSYSHCLNNLATFYHEKREYHRAEPLLLEHQTLVARIFGKEHREYAIGLNNLAALYQDMEDYVTAEAHAVEANSVFEIVLGVDHPHYATSLINLAGIYRAMGDFARAETFYVKGNTIFKAELGGGHPHYATCLNRIGSFYKSIGEFERAEPLLRESVDITLDHLNATSYIQAERQQIQMGQLVRYQLDNYLKCCLDGNLDPTHVLHQIIHWKGAILRRGRSLRLAASDPAVSEQFRTLQSLSSQLLPLILAGSQPGEIESSKNRIKVLRERIREVEADLNRHNAGLPYTFTRMDFDEFRRSIPANTVLINYLEYSRREGNSIAASVMRREGKPILIDLGSAEIVGRAIDALRKHFVTDTAITPEARATGAELRKRIWEPLTDHVAEAELVLVSTDGALGRFPLAALPGAKPDTYLIEDHRLAFIPVPQLLPDVVSKQKSRTRNDETILLVGDVDYGPQGAWSRLEETGKEVEFIKEVVMRTTGVETQAIAELRAGAATESAFRDLAPKASLIHLATHGYFAAANKNNALSPSVMAGSRGVGAIVSELFSANRRTVAGYSPGQLSGLVFAGANGTSESISKLRTGNFKDDGIMTANEIAFVPLERTELAVLSACETGLGEVAGGEGLLGIQRAFQVAGADSVIATMWKVDDFATRKLMERFYVNFFSKKMSKLDALRDAQLWILRNPALIETANDRGSVRDRKQAAEVTSSDSQSRTNPYYWAPFVLSGDWR